MTLGEVCEHGSLKRQCLVCELQEQLRAADELAKAGRRLITNEDWLRFDKALAAYEKVRGAK